MDALAPVLSVAKFVLLLAGLLVPGATLMRALRAPTTIATAFAGSTVTIYATVLALQLTGLRISLGTMAAGLAVISVGAFAAGSRGGRMSSVTSAARTEAGPPLNQPNPTSSVGFRQIAIGAYSIFAAAALWRAWHEPLAGPDIEFRWSFLAEQMLRLGSLDFYPPRTAEDFAAYFWAESVPPGASALHAWAYACAGGTRPEWTVPAVALQLVAVHELIARTATRVGGRDAGWFALLAAAACPLLTWSILLGQETGLTSLALVGIAFSALHWGETREPRHAALIGIFATVGAAAREYGLVFPALAALALFFLRSDRRTWVGFAIATSLAFVWPLRTWILTGNPFHSLNVAGLFPTNPIFLAWIEHDAPAFGASLRSVAGWGDFLRYLALFAPTAAVGGAIIVVATICRERPGIWAGIAGAVVLALWAMSVRYTGGGLFYSLRVAAPAMAIAVLGAGVGFARLGQSQPRKATRAFAGLTLAILATVPATLSLPRNPWRVSWRDWPAFAPRPASPAVDPTLAVLLRRMPSGPTETPRRSAVIADAPGFQRRFLSSGVRVIPPWSPEASWLFSPSLSPAEAARQWRELGIRHVIVTKWQSNLDFFNRHSRWARPPFQVQLIGETDSTAVFSLRVVDSP